MTELEASDGPELFMMARQLVGLVGLEAKRGVNVDLSKLLDVTPNSSSVLLIVAHLVSELLFDVALGEEHVELQLGAHLN